jgi:hypothetical protein
LSRPRGVAGRCAELVGLPALKELVFLSIEIRFRWSPAALAGGA